MGWFWADPAPVAAQTPTGHPAVTGGKAPPPGCPMHDKTIDGLSGKKPEEPKTPASACPVPHDAPPASGCPVPHDQRAQAMEKAKVDTEQPKSILSQLNPLNYMFPDLSNAKAADQTHHLPTTREPSTIPRGSGEGNWEYPSPQQMYNALLRKGYTDTDVTAVESMVSVHNFLNEGAWDEIVGWERRFSRGLMSGYNTCRRGEANTEEMLEQTNGFVDGVKAPEPTLIRFQGRPKDMTPKATMMQVMGWMYPSKFGTEPPFDRHDWFVSRKVNGEEKQIRYVIDYYSGEPEADGLPVFYLDVRPAATPLGTAERAIRWGTDVWWRAIGGDKRETDPTPMINPNVSRIWKSS